MMIIDKLKNRRGVSLTLITGLVSLLMVTSAAMSELIISNLRAVQRVEASNKAYYAAEAGLEDALYELSSHFPGYETPPLGDPKVRSTEFNGTIWKNEWQIESRSNQSSWVGKMSKDEKLMVFLFDDTNNNSNWVPNQISKNAINTQAFNTNDIKTLNVSGDFSITFQIPDGIITSGKLAIDNDGDYFANGVNEDGPFDNNPACKTNPEDADCDGLVDEDSKFDPVIMWKLTDGAGRTLIPIKGCLDNTQLPGSNICEDSFVSHGTSPSGIPINNSVTLDQSREGTNQDGQVQTIGQFISDTTTSFPNTQLHFEFLIVAPMEHVQAPIPGKKFAIPYIGYTVKSNASDGTKIPYPSYTIKSDGYYQTFKQSINATITPKTTVPLFDFTIIQQQ
jgi:hypothetical protein